MYPNDAAGVSFSLRLLGPFELQMGGQPLPRLRFRKSQAVLALLALRHGGEVERGWLAGLLWPDHDPSHALHSLRNCLTDLRAALDSEAGRLLSPASRSLALDLTGAFVDALVFDAALARGDPAALAEAIALYRGPLLEGNMEAYVFQERQEREQGYLGALEKLASLAQDRGELAEAERFLRMAVATDPLRESAQRGLLTVLAAGGNYTALLANYRELRSRLHRETNSEPDPETQALFRRLRDEAQEKASVRGSQHAAESTRASVASGEAGSGRDLSRPLTAPTLSPGGHHGAGILHKLPLSLTSFIGRQDEMAAIQQLLAAHRLVTLTGAGGCGKSRLALETATGLLSGYPNGIWFVGLASLADPAVVPQTVAAALGILEEPGRPMTETLIDALKLKRLLLLLDNCEHLVGACGLLAESLLKACPHLRLLATSREPLGCEGEWLYRVPSLSLPPAPGGGSGARLRDTPPPALDTLLQYEAIRLFVERAAAAQPGFAATAANAPVMARICRRLDGIPLAIELAAARLKAMPLDTLHERLADMFGLLTGGRRTALPQHQTLRAAIDWSYALLTPEEQTLLQRLSVFAGGCTLEAAEAVCNADVFDLLTRLVEKSLVIYEEREGEGRYRLLEMIREHARERLVESGGAGALARQHAQFFLALAETAQRHLAGVDGGRWLDRLEREHDNLRAALAWSCSADAGNADLELALRLAGALIEFWSWRGYHQEGRDQLLRLLARPGPVTPTLGRARGLSGAAHFAQIYGDLQTARALREENLAVWRRLDDPVGIASALVSLGDLLHHQGDRASGRALLEEGLSIYRAQGDRVGIAHSLNALAWAAYREEDMPAARTLAEESREIGRGVGNRVTTAVSLRILGLVAQFQQELASARALSEEGLEIRHSLGDRGAIADILGSLAAIAELEGDLSAARALSEEGLAIQREREDRSGLAAALQRRGAAAYWQRDLPTARALFEESLAIRRELGELGAVADLLTRLAEVARQEWDIPAARLLADEGLVIRRKLGDPGAIAAALFTAGWVTAEEGSFAAARAQHEECLAICRQLNDRLQAIGALDSLGCMAFWQGDLNSARALFEEALAIARALNQKPRIAWSIRQLGGLAEAEGDYPAAAALLEEALRRWRGLEEPSGLMATLFFQGWTWRRQGEYPAADAAFREMFALARERRWRGSVVTPLCLLGEVAGDQGDWERAANHFADGLQRCRSGEGRHPQAVPQCLNGMARVALAQDRPVRAARLLGAVLALWAERGPSAWEIEPRARRDRDRNLAAARAQLSQGEFAAAWAAGQALPVEEAIAEALWEAHREGSPEGLPFR